MTNPVPNRRRQPDTDPSSRHGCGRAEFCASAQYLEGNYYSYAVSGRGIAADLQTGSGVRDAVVTELVPGNAHAVGFTDEVNLRQYAREITSTNSGHIGFLRRTLGSTQRWLSPQSTCQAAPLFTIREAPLRSAPSRPRPAPPGVVGPNDIFVPFSDDKLPDRIVSADRCRRYRLSRFGAPHHQQNFFLRHRPGCLATECYHDGVIRAELWRRGLTTYQASTHTHITQISNARDSLDGLSDTDQDIGDATTANLVPTDSGGLVLGRSAAQVLNVVYQSQRSRRERRFLLPCGA